LVFGRNLFTSRIMLSLFALTLFLMRYVAPLGILMVFAAQLWK